MPLSPFAMLSTASASSLDVAIRDLIAEALRDAEGGYTRDEIRSLLISAAAIVVEVLRDATSATGNPLSGLDKKSIAIEALNRLLDAIAPKLNETVMSLIIASVPMWAKPIFWVIKLFWDSSAADRLRDRIPTLVQAMFDGPSVVWARRSA